MDQQKQPTEEMLTEARRLAFFADEVLSQEIMNSYEKTKGYINRHTQKLVDDGVIQKKIEPYIYTEVEIKESKKWNNLMATKLIHWPLAIYLALSLYFLIIDMNDWVFNLSQFNPLLLEWFSKAQYWINISVIFREKMIILYFIFHIFQIYVLLVAIYLMVIYWTKFNVEFVPTNIKACKAGLLKKYAILGVFIFAIFIFFNMSIGSQSWLNLDQLDQEYIRKGIISEYRQWNSVIGFLITKGISMIGIGAGIFWGALVVSSIRYCKNKV